MTDERYRSTLAAHDAAVLREDRAKRSSPETEPVAWTNEAQLEYLKDKNWSEIPMAMWAKPSGGRDVPLYRGHAQRPAVSRDQLVKTIRSKARVTGHDAWEGGYYHLANADEIADAILALSDTSTDREGK